jgi:hypothetical protein
MSESYKLQQHIWAIEKARSDAFSEGNWDRVDYLTLCLDDSREQLEKLQGATA